ncbi:MAG: hypoxanthine/guanine phosphoribosyltransferase [Candidatus Thermoplasmatota archaeon]
MTLELFKQSLYQAPIIKKDTYSYLVHPLTDGIPLLSPALLCEVVAEMKKQIQTIGAFDRIVTIEAMGIPLATALSLDLDIPFTILRKRKYQLPGERSVGQVTGYSQSKLYINGLKKGDTVIIVDDVLSTGGTLRAILEVFHQMDIAVKGVFIAVNKGTCKQTIASEYNVRIHTLVDIAIINGAVVLQ